MADWFPECRDYAKRHVRIGIPWQTAIQTIPVALMAHSEASSCRGGRNDASGKLLRYIPLRYRPEYPASTDSCCLQSCNKNREDHCVASEWAVQRFESVKCVECVAGRIDQLTRIWCTRLASPSGLEGEVIAGCPPEIRRQTSCTRDTNLRMMIGLGQPTAGRLDRVAVLWPARDRSSGRNLQRKPPKSRKINREKKPCGTAIGKRARIGSTCSISRTSHTPR
jgi:hypothetical protein